MFSIIAIRQVSGIDLVVADLNIRAVFGQEGEADLNPRGIGPLGADDHWNGRKTVGLGGLNEEK